MRQVTKHDSSPVAPTGRIGGQIWALSLATFMNRATGFLGLFAAVFFSEIGVSATTLVVALLMIGVAGIAGSLAGGQLADRVGKLSVLVASSTANVLLFAILALADFSATWWVLCISALSVFTSQLFVGPASAMIAASAEGNARVTRFAFFRIFVNVGSIVAPALVGIIGRDHFNLLFWLSAGGALITPVILLAGHAQSLGSAGQTDDDSVPEYRSGPRYRTAPHPLSVRPVARALPLVFIGMAIAMAVYAQHQSAVPLRLQTEPQGLQLYSLLLIINPVIVILVEYPLSHVTKRMPSYLALTLGIVIMGVGVAVTGTFADVPSAAITGWVLFSIGECAFAPMSNSYVAALSTPETQSRDQGRLAAFQAVGAALGPGLGSWIMLSLAGGTWAGFIVMTLCAAALIWATRRSAG